MANSQKPIEPDEYEDENTDPEVYVVEPRRIGAIIPKPKRAAPTAARGVVDDILEQGKKALRMFGGLMSDDKAVDKVLDEIDKVK